MDAGGDPTQVRGGDRAGLTPVEQIVEESVEVPKIEYQVQITERAVERGATVPRHVDVPQIQKRVTQQPVEQIIEEIVEVPKIY